MKRLINATARTRSAKCQTYARKQIRIPQIARAASGAPTGGPSPSPRAQLRSHTLPAGTPPCTTQAANWPRSSALTSDQTGSSATRIEVHRQKVNGKGKFLKRGCHHQLKALSQRPHISAAYRFHQIINVVRATTPGPVLVQNGQSLFATPVHILPHHHPLLRLHVHHRRMSDRYLILQQTTKMWCGNIVKLALSSTQFTRMFEIN